MMKKFILVYLFLVFLGVLTYFGYQGYKIYEMKGNIYRDESDVSYVSRIHENTYQVYQNNKWEDITIKGVNLGAAQPGNFPGDMAINKATYIRWFQYISKMNANTIRVYTLQNTAFYEALYEFNLGNNNPLYVIHGVWVNEEAISTYYDVFHTAIYDVYMEEAYHIIDAIHGQAIIEPKVGSADGTYTKDVSQYVIGWILGIEFEADCVITTNENNPQKTSYNGTYLYTENASPFEVFLAETGDDIISYEMDKYRMQRVTSFTNWLTTDPLEHPNEPSKEMEDAVSIDVEHVKWKESFKTGMFASYHIYPYYPDFLNYDQKYISTKGTINTFKAYLEELTAYHSMPVLVAEFGLPTSRGIAHRSVYSGYNQGYLTEKQQGEYLSHMIDDIVDMKCAGFLVFSWQDEWFKRSWNTMDLENQEGRPYWLNVQTAENVFGLLSFEPGEKESIVSVDGQYEDWNEEDILLSHEGYTLSVQEDSTYLYLLVETKDFDFSKDTLYIPIDTIQNQGNNKYREYSFDRYSDFMIQIQGADHTELLVDPYYDVFYYQYAEVANLYPKKDNYGIKNSNEFVPILLAMNRGHYLPETKEYVEFETANTGKLTFGISNSKHPDYNSLSDFYYNEGKIEFRIPWGLLSFSSPANCEILDNLYDNNHEIGFTKIDNISFGITLENNKTTQFADYSLKGWTSLTYHERLKQSYYILQDKFATMK